MCQSTKDYGIVLKGAMLAIFIILLTPTMCSANDWCYDFPRPMQWNYDALHFTGSYGLTDLGGVLGLEEADAALLVMTLGVFWEVGQALLWQSGDHYNGDRVDAMDMCFNLGGILLHAVTHPGKKGKIQKGKINKCLFCWE